MLRLSTKSSYGLRACLTLAASDRLLSSGEIAERDGIPHRYLEQILSALRRSGIVKSTRGSKGGYALNRPPEEITVADLVCSLEGDLPPMLCTNPELQSETCREDSDCDCRSLCMQLESSVTRVLEGTNLASLLPRESLNPNLIGKTHEDARSSGTFMTSSSTEINTR